MNNDELRDQAHRLAVAKSLRALFIVLRDKDPGLVAKIAATADHLIGEDTASDDVKAAAATFRRKVLFAPFD